MSDSVYYQSATSKARMAFEAERAKLKADGGFASAKPFEPIPLPNAAEEPRAGRFVRAAPIATTPSSAVQQSATVQWREERRKALNLREVRQAGASPVGSIIS